MALSATLQTVTEAATGPVTFSNGVTASADVIIPQSVFFLPSNGMSYEPLSTVLGADPFGTTPAASIATPTGSTSAPLSSSALSSPTNVIPTSSSNQTASTQFSSASLSSPTSNNGTLSNKSTGTNAVPPGYIAGVAVAAAVAGLALLALAFVLLRNRRKHYAPAASSDKDLAFDPSVIALKDKVANLQDDLNSRDANLREAQGALLASGRGFGGAAAMDDKTVNGQFARLNKDLNDWVLTHFKNARPAANPPRELTSTLIRTQSNYSFLLQESRTRYLLLRAIAAEFIAEAMNDGTLFGNSQFTQMQQSMSSQSSDPAQFSQWRALTASMLSSNNPAQSEAISALTQRIDYSTSSLVNAPASDARLQHLQRIVQSAQQLAIDLAKQQANFTFERPQGSMFDPVTMEDVLQEKRGEDLRGKQVQSVVFPAVFRYGNNEGTGYGQRTVISKAAVLV